MLAEWTGPYGGVPAFDKMSIDQIKPAMQAAMAAHLSELDAIAGQSEPATFENTLVAMERSGELVYRAQVYFGIYSGNLSSEAFRTVQAEVTPMYADYQSKMMQNDKLFARIEAVRNGTEFATLRPDQQRLVHS
jgi:peptidyl-dipeptidase Dcp